MEFSKEVVVGFPGRTIEVQIPEGVAISGRVTTADGLPVASADIQLQSVTPPGLHRATRSDGDGRFQLSDVPPGEFALQATRRDQGQSAFRSILVRDEDIRGATLRLQGTGKVSGEVVGVREEALATIRVSARRRGSPGVAADTMAAGKFHFSSLLPGTWTLTGRDTATGMQVSEEVAVQEDTPAHVTLDFSRKVQVRGTLKLNGTPVATAEVYWSTEHGPLQSAGTTDHQGRLEIAGLPQNEPVWVRIRAPRSGILLTQRTHSSDNHSFELDLMTSAVEGTVMGAEAQAIAAAKVSLYSREEWTTASRFVEIVTHTDGAGAFALPEVPHGEYHLRVEASGFLPKEIPVEVQGGAHPSVSINLLPIDPTP
jgi:hypothetical protein